MEECMLGSLFLLLAYLLAFLPAIIFYGLVVGFSLQAFFAFYRKQTRQALGFLAAALAPCLLYAAAVAWAGFKHHRVMSIAANIENQSQPKLDKPPRTLVIHTASHDSAGLRWQGRLVEMGAFDEVYLDVRDRVTRLSNEPSKKCVTELNVYRARTGFLVCATETGVGYPPVEGLHLYLGNAPRSPASPFKPDEVLTSRELRMITGTEHRTVGIWARAMPHYPVFPPVLFWGSFWPGNDFYNTSPDHGEIAFIVESLDLSPENLKPHNVPDAAEVRAEFIRLRDSGEFEQQKLAGRIATAVGTSVLSADDAEPVMMSNAIDSDLGGEIGFSQFCGHIDRLCDLQDRMISVCKAKRTRDQAVCDRLPQQCAWCKQATLCRPYVTGRTAGCSPQEIAASEVSLDLLRPRR
jgi:hypothetical protein